MRTALTVVAAAIAAAAGSCAVAQTAPSCYGSQQPKMVAELLFGRDVGNRFEVSELAWTRFLVRELTPRFPDGITVTDALGQWRDRDSGRIVREPSKHVEIVLPGGTDDEAKLEAVVTAYKRRFRQQSVGVIVRPACVAF